MLAGRTIVVKNHIDCRHLNTLPDGKTYSIQDPYELLLPIPLSVRRWPWCGTFVRLDIRSLMPGQILRLRSPTMVREEHLLILLCLRLFKLPVSHERVARYQVPGHLYPIRRSQSIPMEWGKTGNVSSFNGSDQYRRTSMLMVLLGSVS